LKVVDDIIICRCFKIRMISCVVMEAA